MMTDVTKLTNKDSIERWRQVKKESASKIYRTSLGCVGEPVADALDRVMVWVNPDYREAALDLLDVAAAEARDNLREYVNDARQAGADEVIQDLECAISYDSYDVEVDVSDSLADVAERGFELCLAQITGLCWTVSAVSDEEL